MVKIDYVCESSELDSDSIDDFVWLIYEYVQSESEGNNYIISPELEKIGKTPEDVISYISKHLEQCSSCAIVYMKSCFDLREFNGNYLSEEEKFDILEQVVNRINYKVD